MNLKELISKAVKTPSVLNPDDSANRKLIKIIEGLDPNEATYLLENIHIQLETYRLDHSPKQMKRAKAKSR